MPEAARTSSDEHVGSNTSEPRASCLPRSGLAGRSAIGRVPRTPADRTPDEIAQQASAEREAAWLAATGSHAASQAEHEAESIECALSKRYAE
jgi:hypothetical protein